MNEPPLTRPAAATPETGVRPTVLVVEDEETLRAAIRRLLSLEGYAVLEAQNGAEALQLLLGASGGGVDLVLTDLRMPIMDGRQLAAALARNRPGLPIVFMSGFTAQLMDMRLVSPQLSFLSKPFRNDDLLVMVRRQLTQPT
jgi:two-component system cell cycle sensor histidine kinase/response regulator CckA